MNASTNALTLSVVNEFMHALINSTSPTAFNHGITAGEEVLRSAALLLPHHCQFEAKTQNAQNAERSWRCLTHPTVATVLCPEANISPCWAEDCHSVFDLGRRRAVMNERNPVCCVHCGLVVGVHGRVVVGIGGGVFSDVAKESSTRLLVARLVARTRVVSNASVWAFP